MKQQEIIPNVEEKIITLRNQQVILDCDVAELYGVATKEINQAVRNNPEKFPDGYIFELDSQEKGEVVKNFDHLQNLRFSPQFPKAFSEKGLYMLATILKSSRAVQTTIAIVEAYAKLKELSRVVAELPKQQEDKEMQKKLAHRSGQLVEELMSDVLAKQSSETTIEMNLAMFKIRHSVRRENVERIKQLEEELAQLRRELEQKE
ncbi:MAG: ORF6N domain-containing protein [Bacteroidales bacterium]|nr:ORF6N domain-containing protein [Bacteroidales bacterium]